MKHPMGGIMKYPMGAIGIMEYPMGTVRIFHKDQIA